MPKGTEIKFGPWPDGINLLDEPDQLRDSQLSSCVNFDIDNTGVLSPRRAIRSVPGLSAASTYYLMGSAVLASSGSPYAFINCYTSGTDTSRFEARQDPNAASPFSVTHAGLYKSIVQYGGSLWYVPGQASSVGYSTPASVGGISTPTSVPLIPWGDYGFILKDRLFVDRKSVV